jgi:membrane dipeptidase
MYICDCHCDSLTKVFEKNQNLYQNDNQLDIKRIIANGNGLQFLAIWIPAKYSTHGGAKYTLKIIDKYYRELENLKKRNINFINILNEIDLKNLEETDTPKEMAFLLAIEGGEAIEGSIEVLRIFYRLGVRCMTLTWNNRNHLADGVGESITGGGLTEKGRLAVCEMNELGMLIDVSHIAEKGFWDVIEITKKPIIATHSNAKAICSSRRNLTDEQLRAIAKLKGVVGINIYPEFLENDPKDSDLDSIYRHVEYIVGLIGDSCVGFGTDFDGIDTMPKGILGVQSMNEVFNYLIKKNYSTSTIENIAYKNVMRVLKEVL